MPRGLGIYALMGGLPVGDGACPLVPGHGGDRGAASPDGGFPLAGRVVCGVLRCSASGGGVGLLAMVMTAGAVRVAVSFGPA